MKHYQHILCAVDLSEENVVIAARAAQLAEFHAARLSLFHVVQNIPIDLGNEFVMPVSQEIGDQLMARAVQVLDKLKAAVASAGLDAAKITTTVVSGSTKHEIIDFLSANHVDLIVLGRHGRHGLSRFLGSTATMVIHNAPCDVLTIHIGEA